MTWDDSSFLLFLITLKNNDSSTTIRYNGYDRCFHNKSIELNMPNTRCGSRHCVLFEFDSCRVSYYFFVCIACRLPNSKTITRHDIPSIRQGVPKNELRCLLFCPYFFPFEGWGREVKSKLYCDVTCHVGFLLLAPNQFVEV